MRLLQSVLIDKDFARGETLHRALPRNVLQATVVIGDQAFYSLANFVGGVLVARACAKEQYGFYVLTLTLLNVAAAVQNNLTISPLIVRWPGLTGPARKVYLGTSVLLSAGIVLLLDSLFVTIALLFRTVGMPGGLSTVLLAMSGATGFVLLRNFIRAVYLAQLQVGKAFWVGFLTNTGALVLLGWSYSRQALTPLLAYGIMALSASGAVLIALALELRTGNLSMAFSRSALRVHWQEDWRIGRWLLAGTGVYMISGYMYPWALAAMKGPEVAGVFGACLLPVAVLNPALHGLSRYLEPRAARAALRGASRVRRLTHATMAFVAVLFAALLVFFLLGGGYLMNRLFGGKYDGLGLLVTVIILGEGLGAVGMPLNCGLLAIRRTQVGFQGQLISAVIAVVIGLPLTYLMGPLGAACSLGTSKAMGTAFRWLKFDAATDPSRREKAWDRGLFRPASSSISLRDDSDFTGL